MIGAFRPCRNRAVSCVAAQTLSDLVADVACLDGREDEGVGLTCNRRALALGSSNDRRYSSVKLQLAVDRQIRVHFLCVLGSLAGQSNRAALAGALGGEGQNSNLRVDAESLCGVCGLDGNLSQLLAALQGYVAFLVQLSGSRC